MQYVCYGGYESERGLVECGVPQGSVLGPLFFLLYVNDMVRACKELDLVLFADDTNIFAWGKDPRDLFEKVNRELHNLARWFRCNKLTLNLKKTEYVYFGGAGARLVPQGGLRIGREQIRRVEGARFLGVWVDESLRWKEQIEKIRAKVSRLLGVLGRAGSVVGRQSLLMLYNALVLPHLQYCLMVWGDFAGNRNKALGESLLRLQKRFAGIIAGRRGKYHSDPIMSELWILMIGDLYRQQLRLHAWKFWNNKLPQSQGSMLNKVQDIHRHGTQSAKLGLSVTTQDHKSIGYRLPKEWESLATAIRGIKSLTGFKNKSRRGFLAEYKEFKCVSKDCYVCSSERNEAQSRNAGTS